MIHPTLYKKTATGATQIWYIESDGSKFRTISGQINGKLTESEYTVCLPKNLGKKNEKTAEQQCELEVAALYKKKLAQGNYNESISDINEDNYFKPMLAYKYEDNPPTKKMFQEGLVFCQPKLDGCLSGSTLLTTDKGVLSMKEIFELKEDIKVLSFNEKKKKNEFKLVLNKMKDLEDIKDKNIQWFEMELENGYKLKITGNHLVYLPKLGCYRRVDELTENDILLLI